MTTMRTDPAVISWISALPGTATIRTTPPVCRRSSYAPKMPTATEMNANEIANTCKEPSVRLSSGW
jgi:hypothetical protein